MPGTIAVALLQRLETMSSNCYAIRAVPEGKPITGPGYYPGPPPAAVSLDSVPVRTAGIAGPGYYPADTTEQRWFIEYRDDQSSRWTALDGRMPEDDFHNDLRPWPPGGYHSRQEAEEYVIRRARHHGLGTDKYRLTTTNPVK